MYFHWMKIKLNQFNPNKHRINPKLGGKMMFSIFRSKNRFILINSPVKIRYSILLVTSFKNI